MDRRTVSLAIGLLCLAIGGCSTSGTGHSPSSASTPTGSASVSTSSIKPTSTAPTVTPEPPYVAPPDGSGYSTAVWDQPQPLPGFGAVNQCAWLAKLVARLKPIGAQHAQESGSGCGIRFPGRENVDVASFGPYNEYHQDTTYLKAARVAGLRARVYSFVAHRTDTICSIELDTRSFSAVTVSSYNDTHRNGSFAAHCARVRKVAEIVARMFVPLAGGHPWYRTPQQPSSASLLGKRACSMVGVGPVIYANDLADEHPRAKRTASGTTCDYSSASAGTVHVLLTASRGGLAAERTNRHATVRATRLGVLPARTEQTNQACTLSAQLATGQVLALTYTLGGSYYNDKDSIASTCLAARSVMAAALEDTLNDQ